MRDMLRAGLKIANEQFLPAWGMRRITGACYANPEHVPPGATVFALFDDAEADGAYGWHENTNDKPAAVVLVKPVLDAGGDVLTGGRAGVSIASTFVHELFELIIDPFCNSWAQMPDGRLLALETADPVQATPLEVEVSGRRVLVSNGVLPAYFSPDSVPGVSRRLDLAGEVKHPFELLDGGYQIIMHPSTGKVTEVYGSERARHLRALKRRTGSRVLVRRRLAAVIRSEG